MKYQSKHNIYRPIICIFAKKNKPVYLEHLFVADYRNLQMAQLELSPKINCFAGNNGVGKTNLLDAVYYLSFCKSAVGSQDIQIIRHQADAFQLQGTYIMPDGSKRVMNVSEKRPHTIEFKNNK